MECSIKDAGLMQFFKRSSGLRTKRTFFYWYWVFGKSVPTNLGGAHALSKEPRGLLDFKIQFIKLSHHK